jgi:hypothetical protein
LAKTIKTNGKTYIMHNFLKVLLFLIIVFVHVGLSRAGSWLSWVLPIPCALLFTAATYGLQGLRQPWSQATDQEGVTQRNGSKWILLLMAIALYIIGLIDRG